MVDKTKKSHYTKQKDFNAEEEGFEPPVPLSTPVFKTGAFDHSATPLCILTLKIGCKPNLSFRKLQQKKYSCS